jgi:hypothetical protein
MATKTPVRGGRRAEGETVIELWRGASGTPYPYTIVEIGDRPNTAYGNYIFAKRNEGGGWDAVFIGHGDLSLRTDLDRHELREFLRRLGVTHVHIHENPWLPDRMIERSDLLEVHPEAFHAARFWTPMSA